MILLLKAVHIAALSLWCAMLVAFPLLLGNSRKLQGDGHWERWRVRSHLLYRAVATPAAVIAIASGIALIFARGVFTEWMLLKMMLVGAMVAGHTLLGHIVLKSGRRGPNTARRRPGSSFSDSCHRCWLCWWWCCGSPTSTSIAGRAH